MATDAVGPADLHKWLAILDEEERERAERFHFLDQSQGIHRGACITTISTVILPELARTPVAVE